MENESLKKLHLGLNWIFLWALWSILVHKDYILSPTSNGEEPCKPFCLMGSDYKGPGSGLHSCDVIMTTGPWGAHCPFDVSGGCSFQMLQEQDGKASINRLAK